MSGDPRPVRQIRRLVERRLARAASPAWLGESVMQAREPKLLRPATRLAPQARPPALRSPEPPPAPARVPPPAPVEAALLPPPAAPAPPPVEPAVQQGPVASTWGMDEALAWVNSTRTASQEPAVAEPAEPPVTAVAAAAAEPPAPRPWGADEALAWIESMRAEGKAGDRRGCARGVSAAHLGTARRAHRRSAGEPGSRRVRPPGQRTG